MSKKFKNIFLSIFVTMFTFAFVFSAGTMLKAKAEGRVDVTSDVTFSDWADENELKYINVVFGEGVFDPELNYDVMDTEEYLYIQDYITFNGRTIRQINSDETLGAKDWEYTVFPSYNSTTSSYNEKYMLPIIVYESSGKQLRLKLHSNFFTTLGTEITVTVKQGLEIVNGSKTSYISSDVSRTYQISSSVDITNKISASGWNVTGNQSELTYTKIQFGVGVLPTELNYDIMDKPAHMYLQEYITVNGKTVKSINEETDTSSYLFATFPSTIDNELYKVPVILYENGNNLEVKIHNDYIASLGQNVDISVGVKQGFYIENAGVVYSVSQNKSFVVNNDTPSSNDISQNLSVDEWIVQSEYNVTYLVVGDGVIPSGTNYDVTTGDFSYVCEYIYINGKSIKDINSDTTLGFADWEYTIFPADRMEQYRLPIILYAKTKQGDDESFVDAIEIKIHDNYLALLGEKVEITVKAGLTFENNGNVYSVSQDKTFIAWQSAVVEENDITDNIYVKHWITQGELKVTYLHLAEGAIPTGVDYGATFGDLAYLQEYIYINGRSIKDINSDTTLNAKDWNYSVFPATADPKYKIPVILFAKTNDVDSVEIKIHQNYLALLEGDIEITAKAGLFVENNGVKYSVSKDVTYVLFTNNWADKNKRCTITYYINGEQYGEPDLVYYNAPLVEREMTEIPDGYYFSGWEYPPTKSVVEDMDIHGYLGPIEYVVTYHLNGGKNDASNPVVYYVTDGEIVLKDAVKDGMEFVGWYTSSDYTEKVEKLAPENIGDVELYAKFIRANGCSSSVLSGSGLVLLLGLALVRIVKKARAF